jgi:outer membrane protein OmpA-like peptidoglycan-associated protein
VKPHLLASAGLGVLISAASFAISVAAQTVDEKEKAFLGALPQGHLSQEERAGLSAAPDVIPNVDLKIEFAPGSADLQGDSLAMLARLERAMPELKDRGVELATFRYAGSSRHSRQQALAARRAQAIRQFFVSKCQAELADRTLTNRRSGDLNAIWIMSVEYRHD